MIYRRPADLAEALALLSNRDVHAVPLSGGTHLLAHPYPSIEEVVDLQDLGLDHIEMRDGALRIGATATLEAVATAPEVRPVADGIIAEAARRSASSALRQQATVAGTLLAAAGYADLPVVLLTLAAQLIVEPGTRALSLEVVWSEPASLLAGSLISEIVVPLPPEGAHFAFQRVSRTPSDRAIVAVAAVQTGDGLRVAIGGGLPHPVVLEAPDVAVLPSTNTLPFATDTLASAAYRRMVAGILIRREIQTLQVVLESVEGGSR